MQREIITDIFIRLPTEYKEMISNNADTFYDCILQLDSGLEIKSNRILLSKYSKWFLQKFIEIENNEGRKLGVSCGPKAIVKITGVRDKDMLDFMSIITNNYFEVTAQSIPYLLKIAQTYSFPQISSIIRNFYKNAISQNDDSLLYFAETFIKNDLITDAIVLAPQIAKHFVIDELNIDPKKLFTIEEIYRSLSPPVFAAVLKERHGIIESILYEQEQQQIEQDQKIDHNRLRQFNEEIIKKAKLYCLNPEPTGVELVIKYIEEYVNLKGIESLTEDDREGFFKVIEYVSRSAFNAGTFSRHLRSYSCLWLPDRIYLLLANHIIDKRRRNLEGFRRRINNLREENGDSASRWCVMYMISSISGLALKRDEIPLIEFIRTLGGSVNEIDVIRYGFIENVENSKEQINGYGVQNAFNSDPFEYFITNSYGGPAFFKFSLDSFTNFAPSKISFDSRICFLSREIPSSEHVLEQYRHLTRESRSAAKRVELALIQNDQSKKVLELSFSDPTSPNEPIVPTDMNGNPFKTNAFRFEMKEDSKTSKILRVTSFEIIGEFKLLARK